MKRVAAIAIINDHHMLMGRRRESGKFTNPGGHLNPGEDPVKGAVREVKEETGLELDSHLFKHLETRIVKKPDGSKIEVHGFRVDLGHKPSTSMKQDPDGEVHRWQWIKTDSDLDHISENLHVPLKDNVLLTHILKDKPMKKHIRKFWNNARKMGVGDELKEKLFKEGPQQYMQRKDNEKTASLPPWAILSNAKMLGISEKKAAEIVRGGKADWMSDKRFSDKQLRMGITIEKEHTTNPRLAKEIAKDHLTEDKNYYTHLKEMEDKYVEKKAFWEGFKKQALLDSRSKELLLGAGLSVLPLGMTGQTVIADRPEGHSRMGEWLARIGAGVLGGLAGGAMAGVPGGIAGSLVGEAMGHKAMVEDYYDGKGKLKKKYKE